jgi:MOSC domain-containing protein YiiM
MIGRIVQINVSQGALGENLTVAGLDGPRVIRGSSRPATRRSA